jgi:hypothetical protein
VLMRATCPVVITPAAQEKPNPREAKP